jgi:hypothetical protein
MDRISDKSPPIPSFPFLYRVGGVARDVPSGSEAE